MALQPRALCPRHVSGMLGAGAQRHARKRPSRSRCRWSSTGGSTGRAIGTCFASRAAPTRRSWRRCLPGGWARRWIRCCKLTDAQGKLLALNDDYEDKGAPLFTHHADSRLVLTLPATGATTCTWATRSTRGRRVCLPPAGGAAAARFCPARGAFQHHRPGRHAVPDHRVCPAARRFRGRDHPGPTRVRRPDLP